jgi:hypothetical protein
MDANELTIAVVGRSCSGKTALVTHLSLALSPLTDVQPVIPRVPVPPLRQIQVSTSDEPPPVLLRFARSALSAVARRAATICRSIVLRRQPGFSVRSLPAPPESQIPQNLWRVIDAEGEAGM